MSRTVRILSGCRWGALPSGMAERKRDEVADYTTIGLAIGLSWREARRVAKEIVADHRNAEKAPRLP